MTGLSTSVSGERVALVPPLRAPKEPKKVCLEVCWTGHPSRAFRCVSLWLAPRSLALPLARAARALLARNGGAQSPSRSAYLRGRWHDRGSSMPPKGSSEGRAPSKYGGFNFSAFTARVFFTSRSNGTTTEKSICTHGSRKEDATKRDLWVEVVNLWINKLKVHRAWKKVEVPTHPLSLTCISRYTGHYRDREMGAIQAKRPD